MLIIPLIGLGQEIDTSTLSQVDTHVDSLHLHGSDVALLSSQLVAPFKTDLEKIRAIYRFATTYLEYDQEAYHDGQRRINRSEKDALLRGKAVCWGYAEVVKALCSEVGIKCYTVSGYARDAPIPNSSYENANHVWNAVQIDGNWHLLDATWGSCLLNGDTYFTLIDGIDYFLPRPDLLIHSHYPLVKMWQLMECPITYEDFLDYTFDYSDEICDYNFPVHIDYFLKLDFYDQQVAIVREAYDMNPTFSNRKQVGHALVDVAVRNKELGDEHFENDSVALAIEELEAATQIFDLAHEYADFYPWQSQAMVYGWANLAQALHRREAEELRSRERINNVISRLDNLLEQEKEILPLASYQQLKQLVVDLTWVEK